MNRDRMMKIRREPFGAIVYDCKYCCFAAIGDDDFSVLSKFGKDKKQNFSDYGQPQILSKLKYAGYLNSGMRNQRLLSTVELSQSMALDLSGPIAIGIHVTNVCNLNCRYCYAKGYSIRKCSLDSNYRTLVDRLIESNVLAVWVSGGEPTLWSNLKDFIDYLADEDIGVSIDTNGVSIGHDLLDTIKRDPFHLRISIDSHIKTVHDSIRGHFHETWNTMRDLLKCGVRVSILTVVHKKNISTLEEFADRLIETGVKRWILLELNKNCCSVPIQEELFLPEKEVNIYIEKLMSTYNSKDGFVITYVRGNIPYSTLMVGPDGNYFTVNTENGERIVLGSVKNDSISSIWQSKNLIDKYAHAIKYLKR